MLFQDRLVDDLPEQPENKEAMKAKKPAVAGFLLVWAES